MESSRAALAIIAVAAAAQVALAVRYFGFFIGDEMEMVSEAFRAARGMPYAAWDIRCLFVPDVIVATPIRMAAAFGIADNAMLLAAAKALFIALSAATNWLVYKLALRWTGDGVAALSALTLFVFHWIPLGFGSMVFPRIVSTFCIVAAAWLVSSNEESNWRPVAAGVLVAIAFADRFSEILFLIPLAIIARRRAVFLASVVLSIAVIIGGYDWLTWGRPFASLVKFAHRTLVESEFASRVPYQGPLWYLETLMRWCALTVLPLAWAGRRVVHWTFILFPLAILSLVPHKEMRYVAGVIPFLMIAAGAGFAILWRADKRRIAGALLAISIVWDAHGIRYLARKSMPAVAAARLVGADPAVRSVAVSQLWAYGDRLFLPYRMKIVEMGTPPEHLETVLSSVDTLMLYESDVTPQTATLLRSAGFAQMHRFDDGRARAVLVYRRRT